MHRRVFLGSAAAAALSACAAPTVAEPDGPTPQPTPAPVMPPLPDGFNVALYRALAADRGNQFVSPYSVLSAFTLLYPGARGQTSAEMASTFGFDPTVATEIARARAVSAALAAQAGGSEFTTANAAWVERTMGLRADYARTIRDELGAAIEEVEFIANQGAALRRINAWAARETRDRIPEILTNRDPARRLVLTNAVYFKGKWQHQFSANATRDGDFFAESGATQRARLMHKTTRSPYYEGEGFQAAEFAYDEGAFALAVFLPRARDGLVAFERQLMGSTLDRWLIDLDNAQSARLAVTLPKVEMRTDYELSPQLQALGLRLAFTDGADFSGVTEAEQLAISAVIHKTFLAIDEEGTEAAAVTAIDMRATSAMPQPEAPPIEFRADHPFFIVLRHKPTNTSLFMGRVAEL
ncbi:serpin family protein [Terricaulis sp.]|uniref:serpin family protein n=1 Tax=Terricaulis sp. TaxID=2768686 RepID=UPI002AC531BA|nr:serpin family protein [Terricaulis sp.]MDZ4690444.1 serpin family protein [Terricaulis sp.]